MDPITSPAPRHRAADVDEAPPRRGRLPLLRVVLWSGRALLVVTAIATRDDGARLGVDAEGLPVAWLPDAARCRRADPDRFGARPARPIETGGRAQVDALIGRPSPTRFHRVLGEWALGAFLLLLWLAGVFLLLGAALAVIAPDSFV